MIKFHFVKYTAVTGGQSVSLGRQRSSIWLLVSVRFVWQVY